jgi:hypothetical protein
MIMKSGLTNLPDDYAVAYFKTSYWILMYARQSLVQYGSVASGITYCHSPNEKQSHCSYINQLRVI